MAYFRKRNYRRRTGKRYLSNYNIATRTSAKSQSKQIYFLKKRINKIQRLTKPEIIIIQRNSSNIELQSNVGTVSWISSDSSSTGMIQPSLGSINKNVIGSVNSNVPNNFARLNGIKIYGNLQYSQVSSSSVPVNLRIVVVQQRSSRQTALSPSDIFTSGESGSSNFSAVFGPLQNGLARTCKVLSDKRYCLSYQNPSVNIKTNLPYLMNFYRDANSDSSGESESYFKGTIYVFYAIYTSSSVPVGSLNMLYKLAYTDA